MPNHELTNLFLQCIAADLESRYLLSVLLESNSLLVLTDDMYMGFLHGISERSKDTITEKICNLEQLGTKIPLGTVLQRSTRVSLTIRNVPKALKLDSAYEKYKCCNFYFQFCCTLMSNFASFPQR